MHHYFEAITNKSGDSLPGYFARVVDPATQNTVTLAADNNGTPIVTTSGVENAAKTDDNGNISFYVVPGTYHLDIYAQNATSFIMRVPNVAMNSGVGPEGPEGPAGPPGEGLDTVMEPTGASVVGFVQTGTGAVTRNVLDENRDWFSPKQFGAKGTGDIASSEAVGFTRAAQNVRNPNDASFSGAVNVPPGVYRLTSEISLPQSFCYMTADRGVTIWGAAGSHVLRGNGAAFVQSELKGLRLYSGIDGVRIDTSGEIASLVLEDMSVTAHTGNGFYFSLGLTSSTLDRLSVTGGTRALWCAAGINNNNVVSDSHFYNTTDDTVRVDGLTNAWQFRNVHIEGGGQAGKSQYCLAAPVCAHILGGWSEGGHEFLLTITTPQTDLMAPGVIIDGLTSIGSGAPGGGFVAPKFNVGSNRIVLGSNGWQQLTNAPALVFIYGVNPLLRVQQSQVWTRDTSVDKRVAAPARTITDNASQTFPLFTVTRKSAADVTGNQQAISVKCRLQVVGYDGGGVAHSGVWESLIFIAGVGKDITSVQAQVGTAVGPIGPFTLTIQQGAMTPSASAAISSTVLATVQGVNFTLPNRLNYVLDITNLSLIEEDGFAVSL